MEPTEKKKGGWLIKIIIGVAVIFALIVLVTQCGGNIKRAMPWHTADSTDLAQAKADSMEEVYDQQVIDIRKSYNSKYSEHMLFVEFYEGWKKSEKLSAWLDTCKTNLGAMTASRDSLQTLLNECQPTPPPPPAPVKKAAVKAKVKKPAPTVVYVPAPAPSPGTTMSPEMAAEIAARKAAAKQTPATPYNLSLKGIVGVKVEPVCITVSESGYPLYCIKDEIFQMSPHTINAPIHGGDASGGTYTLGLDGWWTYEDRSYGKLTIGEIKNKVFHWCNYIGENTQYGTPFPMHLPLEIVKKWGFEDILKKPGVYPSVWGNGIFWDRSNTGPSHGEGHEFRDMVHYIVVPN